MNGAEMIVAERQRQVDKEGWSPEHDDRHTDDEMVWAAIAYAAPDGDALRSHGAHRLTGMEVTVDPWPWNDEWDKRDKHDRYKRLAIAGALIAAEIDRLKRSDSRFYDQVTTAPPTE